MVFGVLGYTFTNILNQRYIVDVGVSAQMCCFKTIFLISVDLASLNFPSIYAHNWSKLPPHIEEWASIPLSNACTLTLPLPHHNRSLRVSMPSRHAQPGSQGVILCVWGILKPSSHGTHFACPAMHGPAHVWFLAFYPTCDLSSLMMFSYCKQ